MRRFPLLFMLLAAPVTLAQLQETITVERILLDVRITAYNGHPITGLGAQDFEVKIGGRKARVESVTWVQDVGVDESSSLPVDEETDETSSLGDSTTGRLDDSKGRLFVVFVQTDFGRNSVRVQGQLHFQKFAEEMVEAFEPEDRVAVFSFDSHLKFRLDFTSNKSDVAWAMRQAILINNPPPPPVVPNPSLARRLDAEEMRRAADSETALIHVANALRPIEGPKTMLLIGWGLGERAGNMVRMKPKWPIARRALEASRVSIFALDTTNADYHDLEIGLQVAAEATGGFYAKTHIFPQIAVNMLQRTLTGHYELELRRPDGLRSGVHAIDVRVKRRGVNVLAPSSWTDR